MSSTVLRPATIIVEFFYNLGVFCKLNFTKSKYGCIFLASKRGRGARVKGNFHLKRGDVLKILVGQEGGVNTASGGAGGGGGSFIVTDDNTPLLIGKYGDESSSR